MTFFLFSYWCISPKVLKDASCPIWSYSFFLIIFFNIYLFLRQRQSMNGGGAEREGDTESETGSRLWAISPEPNAGLELTDREIVTWVKLGHLTDWATQAPLKLFLCYSQSPRLLKGRILLCSIFRFRVFNDLFQQVNKYRMTLWPKLSKTLSLDL